MYALTDTEKLAVQARLNFILGSRLYDELFMGFECFSVDNLEATVFARSEHNAIEIAKRYQVEVAIAIESIVKHPVKDVFVFPKHCSDTQSGNLRRYSASPKI